MAASPLRLAERTVGFGAFILGAIAAYSSEKALDAVVESNGVMSLAKEVAGDDWPEGK